ncbi:MAG: reverse transcriptase domain-containing protein [Cellulosilyticaceae bacterium]
MKRIGNLYEKIYDLDNLKLAHINARKGKGWYKEVQMIDEEPEKYLLELQQMLINKTYKTSEYESFIKNDKGKEREIFKLPYFPDRVCQWAILQVIEPYLMKNLTTDTYSAIPKRGIHLALNKLNKSLREDITGTQYCLKIDVRKYYPNINQQIMIQKYNRLFKDGDLLWLLEEIITSTESGIPIGNYVSQWCGNLYLSDFDHWVKEDMKIKHYFRYMDDCVFLASSKEELHELRIKIENYLNDNLRLALKDNWQVFSVDIRGVDFVGYRCFRKYTLLRKSTYKNLRKKSNYIKRKLKVGGKMTYSEWCSMNSYKGWLKHGDCHNLEEKYIGELKKDLRKYYKEEVIKCKK